MDRVTGLAKFLFKNISIRKMLQSIYKKWFASIISASTEISYHCVTFDAASYIRNTPKFKIYKKYLHKYLILSFFGQLRLEKNHIPLDSNVLFLYVGKRNFGDANMELSGRALLNNKNIKIDLFTFPHLRKLFEEDNIFDNVFSDINDIKRKKYDYILLPEFNHRCIRLKISLFKNLPYACLFRFFDGPSRNQTHFSYAAISSIFRLGMTQDKIYDIAKPYLHTSDKTSKSISHLIPNKEFLVISIGGIDPYRSYRRWPEFLNLLDNTTYETVPTTIVLVGSDNGSEMEKIINTGTFTRLKISSYVGKLSLLQTREVISKALVFVGCDGGLLHVAHSTSTPSISLFSNREPHHMWLTKKCHSTPIQSTGEDSLISPNEIAACLENLLTTA